MRTLFVLAAVFGIFGTGCGGCADDKSSPPAPSSPQLNTSPRKTTRVRMAFDGGADPLNSAGDQ